MKTRATIAQHTSSETLGGELGPLVKEDAGDESDAAASAGGTKWDLHSAHLWRDSGSVGLKRLQRSVTDSPSCTAWQSDTLAHPYTILHGVTRSYTVLMILLHTLTQSHTRLHSLTQYYAVLHCPNRCSFFCVIGAANTDGPDLYPKPGSANPYTQMVGYVCRRFRNRTTS